MFRFITIKVIALVVIFCFLNGHVKYPTRDIFKDKGVAAITKAYPASDERHKFVMAMYKARELLDIGSKEDAFELRHIFPLISPFLKSRNEIIKLCAEDTIRLAKSALNFHMLTVPPNDASDEEVRSSLKKASTLHKKMVISYTDFVLGPLPTQLKTIKKK